MTSAAAAPKRYEALDSLRGLCAIMVVLYHFHVPGVIAGAAIVRHAFLFVDFFFVLSGFVIATGYRRRLAEGFPVARFMGLRLGRVYPLHAVILLGFLAFQLLKAAHDGAAAFSGLFSWPALLASFGLVQIFTEPVKIVWNGPSWSIAAEVWTYLIFALLFAKVGRAAVPLALLVAAGSVAILAVTSPTFIDAEGIGALLRCCYGFGLGVAGAALVGTPQPLRTMSGRAFGLLEVAAVIATLAFVGLAGAGPWSLAAPPLFLLVVLVFAQERGGVSRLLKTAPMMTLGTLSYSIYMIHFFVQFRLGTLLNAVGPRLDGGLLACGPDGCRPASSVAGDLLTIAMLLLVIALSWLTWRFVERPGQAWSRRRLLGREGASRRAEAEQEAPAF
jgi:peptidoglycan/LPS O-acetylase OafA/YrhL